MKKILLIGLFLLFLSLPLFGDETLLKGLHHRPRLTFDGRDKAHIQRVIQRINQNQQPWNRAYGALLNRALWHKPVFHKTSDWKKKDDPYAVLFRQETLNGAIASSKAALCWLYFQGLKLKGLPAPYKKNPLEWVKKQIREALEILLTMKTEWPFWKGFSALNRDIVAASSLVFHCQGYDLLAVLPLSVRPSKEALNKVEDHLALLAGDLALGFRIVDYGDNNHATRTSSSLGYAALALSDYTPPKNWRWRWRYLPSHWMNIAIQNLHPDGQKSDLRYQISTGACAEGTSYYHYGADLHLPFFYGYTSCFQGKGIPFLRHNLINEVTLWPIKMRLPDGRRPIIDNARLFYDITPGFFLSRIPGGVRSEKDQVIFLWDWKNCGYPGITGLHAVTLLAAFDPTQHLIKKADQMKFPPFSPTLFEPKQGWAVLRSGWGKGDSHVLVVAEAGPVRIRGLGHDAIDNGSFAFYAAGDLITIDPGYPGWDMVNRTNQGHHRSMIMVNGYAYRSPNYLLGLPPIPPWGAPDAHIIRGERTFSKFGVSSVEIQTGYRGAKIRRTIILVNKNLLVIEDRCQMEEGKKARIQTQIQTGAGLAKKRPIKITGLLAQYKTNRKEIPVTVLSTGTSSLRLFTTHEFDGNGERPQGHEALHYETRKKVGAVTFLTAIALRDRGKGHPVMASLPTASPTSLAVEIFFQGYSLVVISNPDERRISFLPKNSPPFDTDLKMAVVFIKKQSLPHLVMRVGSGGLYKRKMPWKK